MDYEQCSEILKIELRRDEILGLALACRQTGKIGMAIDLEKIGEIKEDN
jgi:hypothetical protein